MPRGERLVLAHVAVSALARLPAAHLHRMAPYAGALLEQIAGEFGIDGVPPSSGETVEELVHRAGLLRRRLPAFRATGLDRRLDWLCATVGGCAIDREIIGWLARARLFTPFDELLTHLGDGPPCSGEVNLAALSLLLKRSGYSLQRHLRPQSRLLGAGLVRDCRGDDFAISSFGLRIARMRSSSEHLLARELLPVAEPSPLGREDFVHLGDPGMLAFDLVQSAARRRTGVNLLLFGPPGTGKSEFAKVLASSSGLHAVPVGMCDENGGEPDRADRLAHLTVCRSLVRRSRRHALIIDEADDLMLANAGSMRSRSKLFLNTLVEGSTVPTIWIINDPDILGAAVSRRMNLAIEFRTPPVTMRRAIAERLVRKHRLSMAATAIDRLAALDVAPALLDNSLKTAALTDRKIGTVERAAQSVCRLVSRRTGSEVPSGNAFDPSLCLASTDVDALVRQLAQTPSLAWSLLAHGPSGTGKSALARHIADRAGLPVLERKASDLLDMYVGNTEKGIARAFEEAADTRSVLLLDEADSLLRDRRRAERSWEASMTNEMLTWMERSPVPFVATTNLEEQLDPATSRRFLFKLRFAAPDAARRRALFAHYFRQPAPAGLERLEQLTPGDFALVFRRAQITGENGSLMLLGMLEEEAAIKEGARAPMGF